MGWKLQVSLLVLGGAMAFAADANELRMKVLGRGAFSGIQEAKQLVITNQIQWAEIWQKHSVQNKEPKKPAPEVDFSKQSVLFVALGQKRTGGYSVGITDVQKKDGKTEVIVQTTSPKPGGFQIQALTAPFVAVAVPRIEGPVEFKIE
jgi:hypothetical protein